ncbi:MAG: glycosyltransferase [Limnospira sp. PMC 1291.21]|uniref:Glycosyl transferase, family 2 n=3 Tax=Limnospira TaxID=2596745 RepID=A0A9P1KCV4_9CYAN|nr:MULTISPECIES: glycosyltransferase [Limnospira]EKD11227.1 glycosyl transferase family 2 [Arthrospira platensis C1]MDC0837567.1 glycosyltransferase [Limnoraphis robusta]MDY7052977.1 glycosyltransferase [Limnospira fusiformis LS22]QJB27440.1 glycosyltransferase family 2 protein [Limnospira fusiformis SAG 85.79]EDZ94338.1 glycosyl transferase family 2 [Limnospira maxima CS-328]
MFISICVATYKRSDDLKRLLNSLEKLTFHQINEPEIEIVIVDNDASGSAQIIIDEVAPSFKYPLRYDIETQTGVSYARNRTIINSSDLADFIAIIDDDEMADENWLENLLIVQEKYEADVVTGPVIPYFENSVDVPDWIEKGQFLEPRRYPTGSVMDVAYTGNVLVRSQLVKQLETVFDERLAMQGSEDTHLFMRLYKQGAKIVWADEAIVRERIPESRMSLMWLLERSYWGWSSRSLFERELYPSLYLQGIRFLKGCVLIMIGLVSIPIALLQGQYAVNRALLSIWRGAGTISGLLGIMGSGWKKAN